MKGEKISEFTKNLSEKIGKSLEFFGSEQFGAF